MRSFILLLCLLPFAYGYSFQEEFDEGWEQRWTHSADEAYQGKFVVDALKPDSALKVPTKAMHYGLAAQLNEVFDPSEGVTLQFEARYSKAQTCSGAYMKFYSYDPSFKPTELKEETPYTVMFGPDICGANSKVHLILNHKNPKTGEISEKHMKSPPRVKSDKKTHVYTATLKPDNTYEVMVDGSVVSEGSLFEKFDPPINPPEEIPDPDDIKPEDWVDDAKIDDPTAEKPDDWVEDPMMEDEDAVKPEGWLDDTPKEISDPEAVKPEDWDEEEDGEWVAPTIPNPLCKEASGCGEWKRPMKMNPDYKGPWKPPKIDNPDYKGEWKQAVIPNPDYYEDETPLKSMAPIAFLGFELWVMDEDIFFDNIVVTKDPDLAASYREKWSERSAIEKAEEEAEREKKKAAKEEAETTYLRTILELPALSALHPYLEPAVVFLEGQSRGFWGFLGILLSLVLSSLVRWLLRGKKKDAAAVRKKEDISEPDDPPQDPAEPSTSGEKPSVKDEPEEEKETPKARPSRRSN